MTNITSTSASNATPAAATSYKVSYTNNSGNSGNFMLFTADPGEAITADEIVSQAWIAWSAHAPAPGSFSWTGDLDSFTFDSPASQHVSVIANPDHGPAAPSPAAATSTDPPSPPPPLYWIAFGSFDADFAQLTDVVTITQDFTALTLVLNEDNTITATVTAPPPAK